MPLDKATCWDKVKELAKKHIQTEVCYTCEYKTQCKEYGTALCWSAEQIVNTIKGEMNEIQS